MLRLIPAPLHRRALRAAHGVRLIWWRVRRPALAGCRVLAFDAQDRVLLVRHSYGSRSWMLPGGGITRGEAPLAAAQREFAEEAGCELAEARVLTVVVEPLSGASNSVHLIAGRFGGTPRADGREIVELACFAADRLPDDLSPRLRGRIDSWIALALDN